MRARRTLKLRSDKDLKSNRLSDIQNEFRLLYEELDKQYRLLWEDVNTIQVDGDGWIYFGGKNVTGSARIGLVGTDWVCQHFIAGTYTSRLGSRP
ncbi:hypothetical protein LCGC14_0403400 [marine sediment metagenome]|uniref:Uncharacterized protein n=1 Tax=marine sediment metagenome TaxID=412755 RepID=A0A0F9TE42_9ZZZZ